MWVWVFDAVLVVGGVGCLTQCLWLVVLGGGSDVGLVDGGGSRRRRVAVLCRLG